MNNKKNSEDKIYKEIKNFIEGCYDYSKYPKEFSVKESLENKKNDIKRYVYNEFSLQHELGNYLRYILNKEKKEWIIKFEYNIENLEKNKKIETCKKEIDILAINKNTNDKYAIELKYLKNKAIPKRMFKCIEDMKFMNQVLNYEKVKRTYCVAITEDVGFYYGNINKYTSKLIQAYKEKIKSLEKNLDEHNKEKIKMIQELINNKDNYPSIYNYFREKGEKKDANYVFSQVKDNLDIIDISKFKNQLPVKWFPVNKNDSNEKDKFYMLCFEK